jgi:hypothetical protein
MSDINEVFLQAAQVISSTFRMQQQTAMEKQRLELQRQEYESIASAREERIKLEAEKVQLTKERDSLKNAIEQQRVDIAQQNADTAGLNAETGAARAETSQLNAKVRAAATAAKMTTGDALKLQKELDNKVVGVATGDPDLDNGLIYLNQAQIKSAYGKARAVVQAGAPLPPEMQRVARMMGIADQDYAQREMDRYAKLLQFRDNFAKEKLIPAYEESKKNVLKSMSFLEDAKQTNDTSAQQSASDQVRQNLDTSTKAVIGAAPGTIGNQGGVLTPETQKALSVMDAFTSETLSNTDGFNAAAQTTAQLILERVKAGDKDGAKAIGARAAQKSPGMSARAQQLFNALSGNK